MGHVYVHSSHSHIHLQIETNMQRQIFIGIKGEYCPQSLIQSGLIRKTWNRSNQTIWKWSNFLSFKQTAVWSALESVKVVFSSSMRYIPAFWKKKELWIQLMTRYNGEQRKVIIVCPVVIKHCWLENKREGHETWDDLLCESIFFKPFNIYTESHMSHLCLSEWK